MAVVYRSYVESIRNPFVLEKTAEYFGRGYVTSPDFHAFFLYESGMDNSGILWYNKRKAFIIDQNALRIRSLTLTPRISANYTINPVGFMV